MTALNAIWKGPYGNITRTWGTVNTDYRYAGLFYHPQSGLNLATYRAMDGITGRFINRDPIGESGGINLYGYVGGNPVDYIDPLGQNPVRFIPAIITGGSKIISKGSKVIKDFWNDLNFDGPNKGFSEHNNGRICQIRYKKLPVVRLDYHPLPGSGGKKKLHLNIGSEGVHIPLNPWDWFN